MASTWRLQRQLPSSKSGARLLDMLGIRALAARGPQLASIVLGVAIAAQAIAIALSLSGELAAGPAVPIAASGRAHEKQPLALAGITAAHLFGAAPQVTNVAAVSPISRSPLVLTGTIASGNPRDGYAIVGTSAATSHVIYVGSEAAPGTVLLKVFPKWVVLQRGDERLILRFPRGNRMRGGGAEPLYDARLEQETSPNPESDSYGAAFASNDPPPTPQLTDDAAVMRSFGGLVPAKTMDGQDGMQIMGTAFNSKALAAMGLHSGDVIVQINGVAVDAPNAPDIIRSLQAGSVTLTVDRKGEDTSVSVDPSSMAEAATAYRQADTDL
jgi:type II secretory pathway component PulC